ncbi:MAG: hypothetical protein DPW16_05305 [Chloroflexi bacterium]|nr:hypothetical protein [Chloroflexota bacterium]
MADRPMVDIFNDCVERLQAGQSVEDILRQYPRYADTLRPMLEITRGIQRIRVPSAEIAESQNRLRSEVLREYRATPRRRIYPLPPILNIAAALMLTCLCIIGSGAGLIATGIIDLDNDDIHFGTPSAQPTMTYSPTAILTATSTPTLSVTPSATVTTSLTPTSTSSPTASLSRTSTPTTTASITRTVTGTRTVTASRTSTPSPSMTLTPRPANPTPLPSQNPLPTDDDNSESDDDNGNSNENDNDTDDSGHGSDENGNSDGNNDNEGGEDD